MLQSFTGQWVLREVPIFQAVRIERDVLPWVGVSSRVPQPDIVAAIGQLESCQRRETTVISRRFRTVLERTHSPLHNIRYRVRSATSDRDNFSLILRWLEKKKRFVSSNSMLKLSFKTTLFFSPKSVFNCLYFKISFFSATDLRYSTSISKDNNHSIENGRLFHTRSFGDCKKE